MDEPSLTDVQPDVAVPAPVSSPQRIAANRRNARKSSGPRTAAGKVRASRNRLKHGRYAGKDSPSLRTIYASIVELGEDPEEFTRLHQDLLDSYRPATRAAALLVDDLAARRWERQRLERGQAALLARRVQQLEIARQRRSLEISQKITAELHPAALSVGVIWEEDSAAKFQRLLEWLDRLKDCAEAGVWKGAETFIGWVYGAAPTLRGALIKGLFAGLAATPETAANPADQSLLRRELLAEISNVTQQYQLYLRQHVDVTPTMRAECLVPTADQRWLTRELNRLDRQIERKTVLLRREQSQPVEPKKTNKNAGANDVE
ncbi:MAG: hypothetical protein ACRD3T_19125 [Terriglobia bacterium]